MTITHCVAIFFIIMNNIDQQTTVQRPSVRNQYFATIAGLLLALLVVKFRLDLVWCLIHCFFISWEFSGGLISLTHGCILGWTPQAFPILVSENTPLISGRLTNDQISWIGAIGALGVFAGSFLFGFITSLVGCKRSTLFLAVPSITFWLLIYFGNIYHHILMARLLSGLTFGGIQTTIVLYISEIANDKYEIMAFFNW